MSECLVFLPYMNAPARPDHVVSYAATMRDIMALVPRWSRRRYALRTVYVQDVQDPRFMLFEELLGKEPDPERRRHLIDPMAWHTVVQPHGFGHCA